jgi:hypothetical protein
MQSQRIQKQQRANKKQRHSAKIIAETTSAPDYLCIGVGKIPADNYLPFSFSHV